MDFAPTGNGRMIVALTVLAILAVLDWRTMEPGRMQQLVWLLLGFFAFRVVLTRWGVRRYGEKEWSSSGQRGKIFPRKP
jgi:hypothetical protein